MGAEQFETTSSGETAQQAFSEAVERANYDHGHSGYTGTIAEKGEFVLFELPKEADPHRFASIVQEWEWVTDDLKEEAERLGITSLVQRASKVAVDKWGPAAAVELPTESKNPDHREFLFFGWASC